MAETISWCNMMHTLFYIFAIGYYYQLYMTNNFNPVGREFANLVIFGLLTLLMKNGDKI
jgi:hypothetical protein